ncbi:CBS domain-containing protein [Streptomyces pactum]|uniref:CBS domain-containing protein n=1 Tax=Streptomyces pactum TaxID=68249 RepID=UPI0036FBEE2F
MSRSVGDVMTGEVVRAHPDTPSAEIARLLTRHRIGGLPVVDDDDKVMGVVSRTDLIRRHAAGDRLRRRARLPRALRRLVKPRAPGPDTAGELMSSPAVTVHPEQRVADAARIMERRRIDRLPVVDEEDRLIGITTRRDLLRVFVRSDEEIRREVLHAVSVHARSPRAAELRVGVRDGTVTLAGASASAVDPSGLLAAVWRVDGVVGVVNRPASDA